MQGEGVLMSLRCIGGGGINEQSNDTSTHSPPVTRMSSLVLLKARV